MSARILHVSFRSPGKFRIEDLSFCADAVEFVGIVGPTVAARAQSWNSSGFYEPLNGASYDGETSATSPSAPAPPNSVPQDACCGTNLLANIITRTNPNGLSAQASVPQLATSSSPCPTASTKNSAESLDLSGGDASAVPFAAPCTETRPSSSSTSRPPPRRHAPSSTHHALETSAAAARSSS